MDVYKKIDNMSNSDLLHIWKSLNYCVGEMYDDNLSMEDFAQLIYSELDYRGIDKNK